LLKLFSLLTDDDIYDFHDLTVCLGYCPFPRPQQDHNSSETNEKQSEQQLESNQKNNYAKDGSIMLFFSSFFHVF